MATEPRSAVALLRGVNVGGNNKLPMAHLRRLAEGLGLLDVQTYIQSGNLVFRTDLDLDVVAADLEAAIRAQAGVTTRITILTADRLQGIVADNPFVARGVDPSELHVSFLFDADAPSLPEIPGLAEKLAPDELALGNGVVYLRTPNGLGRSNLGKLPKRADGTTRNWRTVNKLLEMVGG